MPQAVERELKQSFATIESTPFEAARLTGLGGSDAGAVAGVNPYKGALRVYLEKRKLVEPEPDNPRMLWGRLHEPTILREYHRMLIEDVSIVSPGPDTLFRHPDDTFMVAHPDALVYAGDNALPFGIVEVKTADARAAVQWGETGTDEIPEHYLLQCQHYMHVIGVNYCDVAVLIGGNDFRVYRIKRNQTLIDYLVDIERTFWNEYVLKGVEPPSEGNDHSKELLRDLYKRDDGTEMVASEELQNTVKAYHAARKEQKKIERELTLYEHRIMSEMKEASTLVGDGFKITWKKSKDSEVVDYKGLVAHLGVESEIIKQFTKIRPGSRSFRVNFDGLEGE